MTESSVLAWTVPDVSFTAAQVAAATGVLDQLGGESRIELAFLGGSLAVGLGHATSDIDLYVVGAGLPDSELTYQHGGLWVHVNPLPAGKVRDLVALGTGYRATGMDRSQLAADVKTLGALVRLATGWPVRTSPDWAGILAELSRATVRKILMARNANIFSAYAEDACGAMRSGDLLTAATAAALALEAGCEATLASAGDIYLGPKFLFRRLARTQVTARWCDYLWHLCHRDLSPGQVSRAVIEAVVSERLFTGGLLLSWCAVDGWDRPLTGLPRPEPDAPRAAGRGPRRSEFFTPIRFVDGWALIGPDDGYEVSESMVRLWRRLDGRPLPDLLATLPATEPRLAGRRADEIRTAVARLAEIGAVPQWVDDAPTAEPPDGDFVARSVPAFSCHPKVAPPLPPADKEDTSAC